MTTREDKFAGVSVGAFRKTTKVPIRRLIVDTVINTKEGLQPSLKGMFVATGVNGEEWAFGHDLESNNQFFFTSYTEADEPGLYTKTAVMVAMRVNYSFTIHRTDYPEGHHGEQGGWLSASGYAIGISEMEGSYELVEKLA